MNGRGERIRTFDPLVPNQMRYQAALRPDEPVFYRPNALLRLQAPANHDLFTEKCKSIAWMPRIVRYSDRHAHARPYPALA